MKTIKQIADELGVSKTAVRKKIDNLGLSEKVETIGNRIMVSEEQEILIKSAFFREKTESKSQTANCKQVSENREVSDLVSTLQNELFAKNQQIKELQKSLSDSQRMLDQQQQLTAMAEQRVMQLEDKQSEDQKHWWQFWK